MITLTPLNPLVNWSTSILLSLLLQYFHVHRVLLGMEIRFNASFQIQMLNKKKLLIFVLIFVFIRLLRLVLHHSVCPKHFLSLLNHRSAVVVDTTMLDPDNVFVALRLGRLLGRLGRLGLLFDLRSTMHEAFSPQKLFCFHALS